MSTEDDAAADLAAIRRLMHEQNVRQGWIFVLLIVIAVLLALLVFGALPLEVELAD